MKQKYFASISAALLLLTTLTACDLPQGASSGTTQGSSSSLSQKKQYAATNLTAEITPADAPETEPDDVFVKAQTAFALNLMQKNLEQNSGSNVLLSPFSVMQALAMTANGAAGDTRTEMENTLGGIPMEQLNPYLCWQRKHLPENENEKLKTANSVWFRDDAERMTVEQDFLNKTANVFGAEAYKAPFDGSTVDEINDWCSGHTDGMIPELLDVIPPDAVMYLINAVCFEAKWAQIYEDAPMDHPFTLSDGSSQTVKMMYSDESAYLEDAHATGFLKYYQGGDYAFAALLPEEGMTPEAYLAQLDADALHTMLTSPENTAVSAGLPKFSFDYDTELAGNLIEMGMPRACSMGADFSGITKNDAIWISRVLHKTHIDVDTEGTKAAAVTAVEMADEAVAEMPEDPKTVILDRPFVFMIVDTENGLPVFSGVLNSVS